MEEHIQSAHGGAPVDVLMSTNGPPRDELTDALCLRLPRETKWKNVRQKLEKVARLSTSSAGNVNFRSNIQVLHLDKAGFREASRPDSGGHGGRSLGKEPPFEPIRKWDAPRWQDGRWPID